MKRIFFAVAALAIAGASALTPANAQGVGVQVGPVGVGVGVGPYWDDGYHHRYWHGRDYAYARDCRVIREDPAARASDHFPLLAELTVDGG